MEPLSKTKSMPKCKICSDKFEPKYFLQKHCEKVECKVSYSMQVVAKQKVDKEKKVKQDWNKEKIIIKDKLKTLTEWMKDLEKPINKICCLLDMGSGCISCNGKTTPQAGHFHTVKSNPSIRFNLDNLHLQDYNCNCAKGGNIQQYDVGLINRYGKDYWEYVKFDIVAKYPILKMAKDEYPEKISIANGIVKWLQLQDRTYNANERLDLRKQFNQQIGIY